MSAIVIERGCYDISIEDQNCGLMSDDTCSGAPQCAARTSVRIFSKCLGLEISILLLIRKLSAQQLERGLRVVVFDEREAFVSYWLRKTAPSSGILHWKLARRERVNFKNKVYNSVAGHLEKV